MNPYLSPPECDEYIPDSPRPQTFREALREMLVAGTIALGTYVLVIYIFMVM